ncbi:hypothetical protein DFH28DRAFT_882946 [Melampsora americana]|nr:hypothetical protein DFH28DRAFT_882946 [Melampsora americana]
MITNPEVRTNGRGRPTLDAQKKRPKKTNARYRPDFEIIEEQSQRNYTCTTCNGRGHRSNNCTPALAQALNCHPIPDQPPVVKKKRVYKCSHCRSGSHRVNHCPEKLTDQQFGLDADLETGAGNNSSLPNTVNDQIFHIDSPDDTSNSVFDNFWGDENETLCPLCDEPLPKSPSEKLKEMIRLQLAKPHAEKRPLPRNPDAVILPVSTFNLSTFNLSTLKIKLCI